MLTLQPLDHLIWNVASFAGFVAAVVLLLMEVVFPAVDALMPYSDVSVGNPG